MENNQNGGNKKMYLAIIVLLALINIAAFYLLYSENKVKKDLANDKATLELNLKTLNDTLDSKKAELEQFRGKNAELDSIITVRETDIDNQKKELARIRAKGNMTTKELVVVKEKIVQDDSQIADLQKRVDELTKQNQQLNAQNQQLSTDLSSEKQTTSQLSEQNKGLSKKVQLGSLLQLKNIMVEGVAKKKNGKESIEKKVKKVESIRITFETGDNKVLEPGSVSLYIRILNPKGEVIAVADQGSGTMKDATSDQTIQYTKQADFDWAQTNKKVIAYWTQNVKDAGTYKVEIYQSGYKVGEGSVTLK